MATGAFLSCTVLANGEQALFVFGPPTPNTWSGSFTLDPAKEPVFTVHSQGFANGITADVVRIVNVGRTTSTVVNGSNLEVLMFLEQSIHNAENSVTVSIQEGWVTDTSGDISGATTGNSPTVSSTLGYPNVVGQAITVPYQRQVGVFTVGAVFAHRYWTGLTPLDSVQFKLADSAAFEQSKVVTSMSLVARVGTLGSATQYPAYTVTFDTTNRGDGLPFAVGAATLTINGFPKIGTLFQIRQLTVPLYIDSVTSPQAPVRNAYVDLITGNDTTAQLENPSLPFLTIYKALKAIQDANNTAGLGLKVDGSIVHLGAGDYQWGSNLAYSPGPSIVSISAWCTFQPAPGVSKNVVRFVQQTVVSGTSNTPRGYGSSFKHAKLNGLTIHQGPNKIWQELVGGTQQLWLHDVELIGMGIGVVRTPTSYRVTLEQNKWLYRTVDLPPFRRWIAIRDRRQRSLYEPEKRIVEPVPP